MAETAQIASSTGLGGTGLTGTSGIAGIEGSASAATEDTRPPRPTATGWSLLICSAAIIVLGYAFGYQLLACLGLAGLAVVAAAIPSVSRQGHLEISRQIYPMRVARGESAVALLAVRNPSGRRHQRITAAERLGRETVPVRIGWLPAGGSAELRYELPTSRRGEVEVGPLSWDRVDPLGLLGRGATLPGTSTLHVHPVVHPFPLGAAARTSHGEQARNDLAPEGSITFHTLREYVPGDDLRRVHWRASAHRGELMVRQNIDVTPPRTMVVLITDPSCYQDPDDFEHAVDVAASAAIGGLRDGQPVSLWTTAGLRLDGNDGTDGASLFLDRLSTVQLTEPRDGAGLTAIAGRLEHSEKGGALIVAGGRPDPAGMAALYRLAAHYGVAVLLRAGRSDAAQPSTITARPRTLALVDGASSEELCRQWGRLAPALTRSATR